MSSMHFCEEHIKALDLTIFQECKCLFFYMHFFGLNIIVMTISHQTNLTIRLAKAAISSHNCETHSIM